MYIKRRVKKLTSYSLYIIPEDKMGGGVKINKKMESYIIPEGKEKMTQPELAMLVYAPREVTFSLHVFL